MSYLVLMIHQLVKSHAFKSELTRAQRDPWNKWFQVRKLSPLVYLLIRDGIGYFMMLVCLCVVGNWHRTLHI